MKTPVKFVINPMGIAGLAMLLIVLSMWGCPQYKVYEQRLKGKAELQRAEQNRQIAVLEALAKEESADHLAKSEVIRAEGVAAANKIIGQSLKGNEIYLHYLWLQTLEATAGKGQTIYIPTSSASGGPGVFPVMGGLPITEANRLQNNNTTTLPTVKEGN